MPVALERAPGRRPAGDVRRYRCGTAPSTARLNTSCSAYAGGEKYRPWDGELLTQGPRHRVADRRLVSTQGTARHIDRQAGGAMQPGPVANPLQAEPVQRGPPISVQVSANPAPSTRIAWTSGGSAERRSRAG